MNEILNFVKPELVVIIPVIYFFGAVLKTSMFKDKLIPVANGAFAIVLCLMYVFGMSDIHSKKEITMALFTAITQGILCAGCATYANQILKQIQKEK